MKFDLILASASPRRKELLSHFQIPFKIITADIEEISKASEPSEFACEIATKKGEEVFKNLKNKQSTSMVISADTIVVLDSIIFGKPVDDQDSKTILTALAGKTHQVITAVSIIFEKDQEIITHKFHQVTDVTFSKIDEDTLSLYIQSGEGRDKAGSYGIQGMGLIFIKEIKGSYSNVVGFPIELLHQNLKSISLKYFAKKNYRDLFKV